MYCVYCGTKLTDDSIFCTSCGKKVEANEILKEDDENLEAAIEHYVNNISSDTSKVEPNIVNGRNADEIKHDYDSEAAIEHYVKNNDVSNEETNIVYIGNVDNAEHDNTEEEVVFKNPIMQTLDGIGRLITFVLVAISVILVIGSFIGAFDKNPIPVLIYIVVVFIFSTIEGKLEDKFPKLQHIVIAIFEIVALIVCFSLANNAGTIASVKEGSPEDYPNITYGEAFDYYFANEKWEKVGKDEDGNEVVKFTGTCSYLGQRAIAEIKFTIYKDQEVFVVSSVKINGEELGIYSWVLLEEIFDDYER